MHRRVGAAAVAVGLVGSKSSFPFMHTVIAAIFAIPLRANVAIAAAVVFDRLCGDDEFIYAVYRTGHGSCTTKRRSLTPRRSEASGELAHFMFWIRQASGPIAPGALTSPCARVNRLCGHRVLWRCGSRANGSTGAKAPRRSLIARPERRPSCAATASIDSSTIDFVGVSL